jgi:hypothetical protein
MDESGKSDKPIVPVKSAKMDYWEFHQGYVEQMKASGSSDRPRAGRGLAKDNEQDASDVLLPADPAKQVDRTLSRLEEGGALDQDLHSALERVRQAACRDKQMKFTSL